MKSVNAHNANSEKFSKVQKQNTFTPDYEKKKKKISGIDKRRDFIVWLGWLFVSRPPIMLICTVCTSYWPNLYSFHQAFVSEIEVPHQVCAEPFFFFSPPPLINFFFLTKLKLPPGKKIYNSMNMYIYVFCRSHLPASLSLEYFTFNPSTPPLPLLQDFGSIDR